MKEEHRLGLPQELLSTYEIIREYSDGGSASRVFMIKKMDSLMILKYATLEGIGYNGKPWNKQQAIKLIRLQECLPTESKNLFPKVFEYNETSSYNYYTMEYFDGVSVPKVLFREQVDFIKLIDNILKTLRDKLYLLEVRECSTNGITINHYNRIVHRVGLLNLRDGEVYSSFIKDHNISIGGEKFKDLTFFFDRLFKEETIEINGQLFLNMPQIINLLEQNLNELDKSLSPQFLPVFAHGDLLLRNILLNKTGEIKLIDVRGENINEKIPSTISLEYEMGKIFHSFLSELIRNDLLIVKMKNQKGRFQFFLDLKWNSKIPAFLNARGKMPDLIRKHFEKTVFWDNENKFLWHTLLSEASHFAADAINRLIQDSSGSHSIAYYIISIILFENILRKLNIVTDNSSDLKDITMILS